MIPDSFGEELNAPRVFHPYFLNPDGTLNINRVVEIRKWHQEMVEHLTLLLSITPDATSPVAYRPIKTWDFLLDGNIHEIRPEQFGQDRRLYGDPKVLRDRIHAAMQGIRRKTGVPWYARTRFVEEKGGTWYQETQAFVRGDSESDS